MVDPPAVSGLAHGSLVDAVGSGAEALVDEPLILELLIGSGMKTNSVAISVQQEDPPNDWGGFPCMCGHAVTSGALSGSRDGSGDSER